MKHKKQKVLFWSGIGICVAGLLVGAQIPYFYLRSHVEGSRLIRQAEHVVNSGTATAQTNTIIPIHNVETGDTETLATTAPGAVLGLVNIPALQLTAPLLEGTDDAELNVGAGHLSQSVQPGLPGTSVIAAHNATWFRHIDKLVAGDTVTVETSTGLYEFRVTGHQIEHVGDAILNTAAPSLVLEACYPLDALYLTSSRFLVTCTLVKTNVPTYTEASTDSSGTRYHAEVPVDLLQQGITLRENSLPMGSLHYVGQPSQSYIQSNAPLSAVFTMVQLYLAYTKASEEKNMSDLYNLLIHAPSPEPTEIWERAQAACNPFFGESASTINYICPFDVTLHVNNDELSEVDAETTVRISGSVHHVHLGAQVADGGVFVLKSVSFQ